MRFELSIALKYLIPKRRQLSASIITLVSVCVVSLVVWLAVVFLSISEGIQKRWVESFTSFHAPLKIVPTEKYYQSYFYQIDAQAMNSGYQPKTLDEKRLAGSHDPYDPMIDRTLPRTFPSALRDENGILINLVSEAWESGSSLKKAQGLSLSTHSTSVCNLKIKVDSQDAAQNAEAFVSQMCYVSPYDDKESLLQQRILPPQPDELASLLLQEDQLEPFLRKHQVLRSSLCADALSLDNSSLPSTGSCLGCSFTMFDGEKEVCLIPQDKREMAALSAQLEEMGYHPEKVLLNFSKPKTFEKFGHLFLIKGTKFHETKWNAEDLERPINLRAKVQGVFFSAKASEEQIIIEEVEWPKEALFFSHTSPTHFNRSLPLSKKNEGHGILVSSVFKKKGAKLGDHGYLSFVAPSATSVQEQKVPVYISGFFDSTTFPFASRYLFVHPEVFESTSVNLNHVDDLFADGIQISFENVHQTAMIKQELQAILIEKGMDEYWRVISFDELDFVRPILAQFQTEKTLFTLIMTIILAVASTNIISMLILLVNDKTKEIGVLQSLGASRFSVAQIFGLCGLITGLMSSLIGTSLAVITIKNIHAITSFLSRVQGREFFQVDMYGGELPAYISIRVLALTLSATVALSILAAVIPALKACSVRPAQILRGEQS
jgi:lipoprotein-releasing system permease protein